MASTLGSSSKPWWSAKADNAPGPEYASEKPKLKSKTLNSLFGRKSKKQSPSLTIPDPPLPMQSIPPEEAQSFTTRPPSKSVSSTRSRPDSLEPRTPSDFHHNTHRHSLLTLSDTDPFASGRSVSVVSSPHLPSDPTRLSAYSNTSSSGVAEQSYMKSNDGHTRASYASSSYSQNQAGGPESPLPPVLPPSLPPSRKLLTKRSDTALNSNKNQQPSPHHIAISGTTSGTLGSNAPSSRPVTRPRGMTDNGTMHKSGFFVDRLNPSHSASTSSIPAASEPPLTSRPPSSRRPSNASSTRSPTIMSPRVVIRQASMQGLSKPAPPPTQRLPPPPQSPTEADSPAGAEGSRPYPPRRLHSNSTASSTMSFASCLEDAFPTDAFPSPPPMSPPTSRSRRISDRSPFAASTTDVDKVQTRERSTSSIPSSNSPGLKKAMSHQSLRKRGLFSASSSTQTLTSPPIREQEKEKEKAPHKLRMFPHPRIPMPPMPLKHTNSSASTLIEPTPQEHKRASVGSVRKRLFSGSSLRRPSTSQSIKDEDTQSVLSCKSDQDMFISTSFFKPWISTQSSGPSYWDEAHDTSPSSPTASGVPDVFASEEPMSPTLGRYEPTRTCPPISFSSPTLTRTARQRGFSVRSSSTVASAEHEDESALSGLSPRSHSKIQSRFQRSNTTAGNGAVGALGVHTIGARPRTANPPATPSLAPRKSSDRPSTAQAALNSGPQLSSAAAVERAFSYVKPSESPPPTLSSLPPPPRRNRPRPVLAPPTEEAPPSVPHPSSTTSSPLASPVLPPSAPPASIQIAAPAPPPTVISLQPPPRRAPRPKISFEKFIHRRSIMRKPSFLDFGNDDDEDDMECRDREALNEQEDVIELFEEPRSRVSSLRGGEERGQTSRPPSTRTNSTRNSRGAKSPPAVSESFLDFARESFDSTRSDF